MNRILLLDIDGVLIQPKGYRSAVMAVLQYIGNRMGIERLELDEKVLPELEARGIFSEFDMIPLLIGTLWNEILKTAPMTDLPEDILEAANHIGQRVKQNTIVDWHVPSFPLQPYQYPAETAWQMNIFPNIPEALCEKLLMHTRDPYRSVTTRLFQQYVLGTERFCRTYHLEANIQTESFIEKFDEPLITEEVLSLLQNISRRNSVYLCVMTSRPSLPPREVSDLKKNYPEEAELALRKVGMERVPLIGLGKIQYVAEQQGVGTEKILKPSAGQSLAAIVAALSDNELNAVKAALGWHQNKTIDNIAKIVPNEIELHVIDDTMTGIYSARAAADFLRASGSQVSLFSWGLTMNQPEKQAAFEKEGIPHFPNWDVLINELRQKLFPLLP